MKKSPPGWDDYRTLNWREIYKYPEVILSQIQQLLTTPPDISGKVI